MRIVDFLLLLFYTSCLFPSERLLLKASVGESVELRLPMPSERAPFSFIRESLESDGFFSQSGMAHLCSITKEGNVILVTFVPTSQGEGLCLFSPIHWDSQIINWPAWWYLFSLPQPPLFSQPFLNEALQPISPMDRSSLVKETGKLLDQQKREFEDKERSRTIFWYLLFVFALFVFFAPFLKESYNKLFLRWHHLHQTKKRQKALRRAFQEKRAAWPLLLQELQERAYTSWKGKLYQATALDLFAHFKEQGATSLSEVALSIEQWGYLPEPHVDRFLQAYQTYLDAPCGSFSG